jgi:hypothetical protein
MTTVIPLKSKDAYEAHFERDPTTGEIIRLRFGDQVYQAGGFPIVSTKHGDLAVRATDAEALRLISRVPLNGGIPIVELDEREELKGSLDKRCYAIGVPKDKLNDGDKVYVKLDLSANDIPWFEIHAGPYDRMRIQFPGHYEPGEILMWHGRPGTVYVPVVAVHALHEKYHQKDTNGGNGDTKQVK